MDKGCRVYCVLVCYFSYVILGCLTRNSPNTQRLSENQSRFSAKKHEPSEIFQPEKMNLPSLVDPNNERF